MMIKNNFQFYNIGHGGFYTGCLKNDDFNFVYDCGTKSKIIHLNNAISRYQNKLNYRNKKINVLFISHLDADHVNGINKLLVNSTNVVICLPYLTPLERLVLVIKQGRRAILNDDYLEFLKSPHAYLINISEKCKIIYFNDNSSSQEVNDQILNENIIDNTSFYMLFNGLENAIINTNELIPNEVIFKKGNRPIIYNNYWELFLYCKQSNINNLDSFIKEVNIKCKISIKNNSLCQSDLVELLSDKNKLKTLRNSFRRFFKSHNSNCLTLMHRPIIKKINTGKVCICNPTQFVNLENWYFHNRRLSWVNWENNLFVTLLTGDIGLKKLIKSEYLKKHFKDVLFFQVPHHGSSTDWDINCLGELNKYKSTMAIINHGNHYKLPCCTVKKDLTKKGFSIICCNTKEEFEYCICLT